MNRAVVRALAYAYATGRKPKKLQQETRLACYQLLEGPFGAERPRADVLPLVKRHPLAQAHDYLSALGFEPERQQLSQLYVSYRHPAESAEAIAYRGGGCGVTRVNDAVPFRRTWHLSAADVAQAVAR